MTPIDEYEINMTEDEFRDTFSENLRTLRQANGLSQLALGKKMGLSDKTAARTIQKWESRERTPSAYRLMLLCQALDCTPGDLLPMRPQITTAP